MTEKLVFVKYPSLTNHYAIMKDRTIVNYLDKPVYTTEKLHGANISIAFNKDLNYYLASRRRILESESDKSQFKGLIEFFDKYKDFLKDIATQYFTKDIKQVHFFGELYGAGIQKMDYEENINNNTSVRFFNIILLKEDGKLIKTDHNTFCELLPESLRVPSKPGGILRYLITRNDDEIKNSALGGEAEGVVYQPVGEYEIVNGHFIGIKHKTNDFSEKRQKQIVETALTAEQISILTEIKSRVTLQRIHNVLSHGDFKLETKNFGDIIKAVQTDIINEINREVDDLDIKLLKKYIRLTGKEIAGLLRLELLNQIK